MASFSQQGYIPRIVHFCSRRRNSVCWQETFHNNLSKHEGMALFDLKRYDDIVLKEADKGWAVVVWYKSLYIEEANRHLCDCNINHLNQIVHLISSVKSSQLFKFWRIKAFLLRTCWIMLTPRELGRVVFIHFPKFISPVCQAAQSYRRVPHPPRRFQIW